MTSGGAGEGGEAWSERHRDNLTRVCYRAKDSRSSEHVERRDASQEALVGALFRLQERSGVPPCAGLCLQVAAIHNAAHQLRCLARREAVYTGSGEQQQWST